MIKRYNPNRISKNEVRSTKTKVLSVWNGNAWVRVSFKDLEFHKERLAVTEIREINEHRTEFFNADGRCVMTYEF